MDIKISIITVCFNAQESIEATINSVLSQVYQSIEYIIIDGGSKDNTLKIINKYFDRIACVISEPDKGIYDAMNKGVKLAHGEWLNFMNAGDVFTNENVLANVFKDDYPDEKTFLYSDHFMKGDDGKAHLVHNDHTRGYILHQSVIYKRKLHETYGLYVVTPQITISDVLFFFSVPDNQKLKIGTPISINDNTGVSSTGSWCLPMLYCAKVIYRKYTMNQMIGHYLIYRIRKRMPILYKIAKSVQRKWSE